MVQLKEVVAAIQASVTGASAALSQDVFGITHSSRNCQAGDIFVAIKGFKVDGNTFAQAAIEQGAVAIISEQPAPADFSAPWLQVADGRVALAQAAAAIYRYPTRELKLVGITGTNGKTTTAYLIDSIMQTAWDHSAMLSTVCNRIGKNEIAAERTTPEASDIARFMRQAVDAGCKGAVMEVSSIAIELHRADSLDFSVVVFTNFTQDHLDYHKTMENYFLSKRKLFDGTLATQNAIAVINLDDPTAEKLLTVFAGKKITYGFSKDADIHVRDYNLTLSGLNLCLITPIGELEINSGLVGKPHIYNIMAATATGLALGFEAEQIVHGIEDLPCVPGRFDRVPCAEDFAVVVDYAHTDDALCKVLQSAREVAQGRIICLFGCGGDKDRTKRPLMGEAAATYSDIAIATSDNPRSEDPNQIINEAEVGLKRVGKPYYKITDRKEAIQFAVDLAQTGDVIVLAGKGHENYQILKDCTIHFDDKEVAQAALTVRREREQARGSANN